VRRHRSCEISQLLTSLFRATMSHLSGEFVKVSSPSPHVLLVELTRCVKVGHMQTCAHSNPENACECIHREVRLYLGFATSSPVDRRYSFWREYGEIFDKISREPDVRAVVLASGLKKLFTAGIDCSLPTAPNNSLTFILFQSAF
jgi:delta(3,5)-delta(2,4)-dienoyl-CoA isomerase